MNKNIPPVNEYLYTNLHKLINLDVLRTFFLVGRTNLALRFKHRISIDIDLASENHVSKKDFEKIVKEIESNYPDKKIFPSIRGDNQLYYMVIEIPYKEENIEKILKIDLIGDVPLLYPIEKVQNIPMASIEDIALMKLAALSDRTSQKDIYDLDAITDKIPLLKIFNLAKKKSQLLRNKGKSFFESGKTRSIITTPEDLLTFQNYELAKKIEYVDDSKKWDEAAESWSKKVHELYKQIGFNYGTFSYDKKDDIGYKI